MQNHTQKVTNVMSLIF